uniref:Cell attachment protein n=1 Tax=Lechcodon virus TaxID=3095318 RepID=A0AAU0QLG4_9MONO
MTSSVVNAPVKTSNITRDDKIKKFYGVETAEKVADSISNNKVFILMNTLLILTGAIVTITLNITNLENVKYQNTIIKALQDEIEAKMIAFNNLEQLVKGDIKPKVTLINSAVSVSIPGQISNLQTRFLQKYNQLEESVTRQCTCNPLSGIFPTSNPSNPDNNDQEDDKDTSDDDKVDTSIKPINYAETPNCTNPNDHLAMEPGANFYGIPNLGPSSSSNDECYTNPSFSIGSSIYMFSQEIRKTDCYTGKILSIQVTLGRIVDKGQQGPQASPLLVWSVPNPGIINSCAVAAGDETGWVLCSVTLTAASGEPAPHTFDSFWLYKLEPDADVVAYNIKGVAHWFDRVYDAVYIGKGGGVQRGDELYFQMYGVSRNRNKYTALCEFGSCIGTGGGGYQVLCDLAVTMLNSEEALVTNAYIKVTELSRNKPVIIVQTFPVSDSYRGSNGRIYSIGENYGVYLAPSSWNRYLRYGMSPDMTVKETDWLPFKTPIMSMLTTCRNDLTNMCPQICSTRGYQDIFPLTDDSEYYTYIDISPLGEGSKAIVSVRDGEGHHSSVEIMKSYHSVLTATISCFIYKEEVWCIAVTEAKKNKDSAQRIYAHSYRIKSKCYQVPKGGVTSGYVFNGTRHR